MGLRGHCMPHCPRGAWLVAWKVFGWEVEAEPSQLPQKGSGGVAVTSTAHTQLWGLHESRE